MLRSVTIENFVRFEEKVILEFKEGANFIIGGNSTGKSSIFELIRRCYSNSINTSSSSVTNKEEIAYTVCSYDPKKKIPFYGKKIDNIFSSYIIEPGKKEKKEKRILGLQIDNEVHIVSFTVEAAENKDVQDKVDFCITLNCSGENEWIKTIFDTTFSKDDIKRLIRFPWDQDGDKDEIKIKFTEVFKNLTDSFVNTFSQRSIGPLQWNRSERLTERKRNYDEANERAEILRLLLKKQKLDPESDDYFESMISPRKAEFEIDSEDEIKVIMDEKTENPVKVLKVPEGIIEAKQISLILTKNTLQTICLEEPDHGMHPQQIERMRNFVLKVVTGKTVVITSHHPSLLNQWALERTYVCIPGDKAGTSLVRKPYLKGKNYVECDEIKKVLFSSHVLLVEGDSDKICIEALFDQEMGVLRGHIDSITVGDLRNCLSKVQIIKLYSKTAYPGLADLCKKLKIKYMVLLDSDAYEDETWRQKLLRNKHDSGLTTEYTKEKFRENYDIIKPKLKDNVFLWREGTLEDVIAKGTGEQKPKKKWWQNETSDEIKEKVKTLLGDLHEKKSFSLLLRDTVEYFR